MTTGAVLAMMAGMAEVEVVVAHQERATLRVGAVFLKIDADQARADVEVEAMALAPVPTPEVLWREPLRVRRTQIPALNGIWPTPRAPLGSPVQPVCTTAGPRR